MSKVIRASKMMQQSYCVFIPKIMWVTKLKEKGEELGPIFRLKENLRWFPEMGQADRVPVDGSVLS